MKHYILISTLLLSTFFQQLSADSHPLIRSVISGNQVLDISLDTVNVLESSKELIFLFRDVGPDTTVRYQLVGYNQKRRKAKTPASFYTSLGKGSYTFKTWLSTEKGDILLPPIHLWAKGSVIGSWWFIPLLVFYLLLLLGGAMYFILLSRFRSQSKLSDLRNDWTNKLHNDIGADLSSVSLRLDTLKRRLKDVDPRFQEGVKKTYTILSSIQKKLRFVFDLVDTKKNSLEVMLSDVEDFAKENFSLQGIKFSFQNHLQPKTNYSIDIGRVNKIYLTLKEAINNSVKYSEAQEAYIDIQRIKEGLKIKIADDGKGFDPNGKLQGNGIANLRQYSREGFINIDIHSAPGQGTKITMIVLDL